MINLAHFYIEFFERNIFGDLILLKLYLELIFGGDFD